MSIKTVVCVLSMLLVCMGSFAQKYDIEIYVKGVKPNSGDVFVAIFRGENSYKKRNPVDILRLESIDSSILAEVELSRGEYAFTAFQDINSNDIADTNKAGIPIEPSGIHNFNWKGIPSFKKVKTYISSDGQEIWIELKTKKEKD